jgi:hypothetical protein
MMRGHDMPHQPLDLLLRDSLAMENCKTFSELSYCTRNIEARHAVEGITAVEREAYEAMKAQHVKRVAPALVA